MDKEDKKKIKELQKRGKERQKEIKKDKNINKKFFTNNEFYDEIFYDYGSKVFSKKSPKRYQRKELKKLKKEGKYEDIYNKYGEKEYNKHLIKAYFNEIKYEKGLGSAVLWRLGRFAKRTAISAGIIGLGLTTSAEALTDNYLNKVREEDTIQYAELIEQYNKNIETYADEVNSLNLSDIQIFMKVMDDMWGSIKGYGTPQIDSSAYPELDLTTEEGQGVCRNMASDVARKLNEINPDYNARTIRVYMSDTNGVELADIDRTILKEDSEEEVEEKTELQEKINKILEDNIAHIGNHLVTLVDIKSENITLVLDPTNPAIGIYKNGTILMFNEGLELDSREITTAFFNRTGTEDLETLTDWLHSFMIGKLTLSEIEEKYGIDAQNQALTEVRALEIANSVSKESSSSSSYTESSKTQEDSFESRIKVDTDKIANNIETTTSQSSSINIEIEDDDELYK